MFEKILAIDVKNKIKNFENKILEVSKNYIWVKNSQEILSSNFSDCDAVLISIYESLDKKIINLLPNLKYVGVLGSSVIKIDTKILEQKKIKFSWVDNYCDHETAEWVIGQIINFYRDRSKPLSVYEKTLGLIGVGSVGYHVAKIGLALGMRVCFDALSEHKNLQNLGALKKNKEEIFSESNIISCHTPAHTQWLTKNLLDLLGNNNLFINTCLGKIDKDSCLENLNISSNNINFIFDAIAAKNYTNIKFLKLSASAYDTWESRERLQKIFWSNIAKVAGATKL